MVIELLDGFGILGLIILSIGVFSKCIYKDKKGYIWIFAGLIIFIYYTFVKFSLVN